MITDCPGDAIVIGYFVRLTVDKGLRIMAAALSVARRRSIAPLVFCCVGNAEPSKPNQALSFTARQLRYRMLVALSPIAWNLAGSCDVLCFPSRTTPRLERAFRAPWSSQACGAAVGRFGVRVNSAFDRTSRGWLVFREGRVR